MRVFLHFKVLAFVRCVSLVLVLFLCFNPECFAQTVKWVGSNSGNEAARRNWNDPNNWDPKIVPGVGAGVNYDVEIGGAGMTAGRLGPLINDWNDYTINSLTIGESVEVEFKMAPRIMTINGDVTVGSKGVLWNQGATVYYYGDFTVKSSGEYKESAYSDNNGRGSGSKVWPESEFLGQGKTIDIAPNGGGFGVLRISSSIILAKNLNIIQVNAYKTNNASQIITTNRPELTIGPFGVLNPQGNQVMIQTSSLDRLTPVFTLSGGGTLLVIAENFVQNYALDNGSVAFPIQNVGARIDYAAFGTQNVLANTYDNLIISGSGTKALGGHVKIYADNPQSSVEVKVSSLEANASTALDMKSFTIERSNDVRNSAPSVAGGALKLGINTTLLVGNAFPGGTLGFREKSLHLTSTVNYNGSNQTVINPLSTTAGTTSYVAYGNLTLSGTGTKTMPTTDPNVTPKRELLTISGKLTADGAVTFAAESNIKVDGDVELKNGATFNGGSYIHTAGGNWINDANFTGNASTIIIAGNGKEIRRNITTQAGNEFYNLRVSGLNTAIKIPSNQTIFIKGDLETTGGGTLNQETASLEMAGGSSIASDFKSISGSGISLNNVTINGFIKTSASFGVNGNFTTSTGKVFEAEGGTVTFGKLYPGYDYSIITNGTTQFHSLNIDRSLGNGKITTGTSFSIRGSLSGNNLTASAGTITFNGNSEFSGTHNLFKVAVTGTQLVLVQNAVMGIKDILETPAEKFKTNISIPNTIVFNGNDQNVNSLAYYNLEFARNSGTDVVLKTASEDITTLGNLTIGVGTEFKAETYTHTLFGNLIYNGSLDAGTGKIIFEGASNADILATTGNTNALAFNELTVNKAAANSLNTAYNLSTTTLNLESGSLSTFKKDVNPFDHATSIKVTLLGERTGNGWVNGTLTRKIAANYQANTDYYFNAPFVKLNFESISSGFSEVTVTSVPQSVSGFTNGVPIDRLYSVYAPAGKYSEASFQIQYNDSELNGNTEEKDEQGLKLSPSETGNSDWLAGERSNGDITYNWVIRHNIVDLNRFWTLSDASNLYIWNGSKSQEWGDLANWDMKDATGAPATPQQLPIVSDIVELGTYADIPNQPIIRTEVELKGLLFRASTDMTLTIDDGAAASSLFVRGSVTSIGDGTATHTIHTNDRTLETNSNLILESGSQKINLTKTTGDIKVRGSVTQGMATVNLGNGNLYIGGDYNFIQGASFTSGGAVIYNGGAAQKVANLPYKHLTINKTGGTAQLKTQIETGVPQPELSGDLAITAGALLLQTDEGSNRGTLTIHGNLNFGTGTLNATNSNIDVKGNWVAGTGIFTPGTGTVTFSGNELQSITGTVFNNLILNNSAGISSNANLTISGNVTVQQGKLNLNTFTLKRSSLDGVFKLADGTTLELKGADNFPDNFAIYELGLNSEVIYSGTIAQAIKSIKEGYGKLTLKGGSDVLPKKLMDQTIVKAYLLVDEGATLDADGKTLQISCDFELKGEGKFNAGVDYTQGTLVLDKTSEPKYLKGAFTVHNLLLNDKADYTLTDSLTIKGNFDNKGTINGAFEKATFEGDFINEGILKSSGIAAFTGERQQTIKLQAPILPFYINPITEGPVPPEVQFNGNIPPRLESTAAPMFGSVLITNKGGVTTSVDWVVKGVLTVDTLAAFHTGSNNLVINTGISNKGEITSAGTIDFSPLNQGAVEKLPTKPYYPLKFGESPLAFQSSGTLIIGGTEPIALLGVLPMSLNNVTISNTSAGSAVNQIPTGVTGVALSTAKLPLYGYNGMGWNILGNFTIESGSIFNAGSFLIDPVSKSAKPVVYNVTGNFKNDGVLNASQATFTFKGTTSKVESIGTTNFGNLTTFDGASLTIDARSGINIYGNLIHDGSEFISGSSVVNFVGVSKSVIGSDDLQPIKLSTFKVNKDNQENTVELDTDLVDILKLEVDKGTLDLKTSNVTPKPDIVETVTYTEIDPETGEATQVTETITTPITTTIAALDGATIKVGGTSTLPAADVFSLAPTSTVEYYGGSKQVKSVQYGNLSLINIGATTFESGTALIAGNLIVGGESGQTITTPETVIYNGSGNQIVAALPYTNLTLSAGSTKIFASKHVAPGNKVLSISGVALKDADVTVDASGTDVHVNYNGALPQDVLPGNYYNLTLSGSGLKTFKSETGIANTFDPGTGLADLSTAGNTINFNGTTDQSVPALTYKHLKVSGSGTKTLLGDATANENITMAAGTIATDAHTLTLGSTASIVDERSDSYVTGRMVTTRIIDGATSGNATNTSQRIASQNVNTVAETFGNIGLSITPVTGTPGEVTVTRVTGTDAAVGNGKNVRRYFLVEPTTPNATNRVNIEATYLPHELIDEIKGEQENFVFYWSDTNVPTSNWRIVESSSATDAVAKQKVAATNVGQAGYFTLGSRITPLPVELISFTAVKSGTNAVLKWATASEQNNSGFEVQVSIDGQTFKKIGFVESRVGSSSVKQEYSFTDSRNGKNGVQYYRLKQIDFDGTSKLYGPKAVDFGTVTKIAPVVVYPNPFADKLRLLIETPTAGAAKVKLYTATGRLLKEETLSVEAGKNDQALQVASGAYEPGLYLLVVEVGQQVQTIKLMKE